MNFISIAQGTVINIFMLLGFVALLSMFRTLKPVRKRPYALMRDGILFGIMATVAMMVPTVTGPGVMFDCRSGVIGAAALLGGPWCALISVLFPLFYRLHIGGAGLIPGLLEILLPAVLGSIYYRLHHLQKRPLSVRDAVTYSALVGTCANSLVIGSILLFMPYKELLPGTGSIILVLLLNGPVSMAMFSILLILDMRNFENAEIHSSILRTAMDGYWLSDQQGRLHEVNETYSRMSGFTISELLAGRIADFEAVMNDRQIADQMNELAQGNGMRFESCHRRKDGSTFDIEASITYLAVAGGRFVSFIRDITDRKKAEEALRQSEEKYKLLIEATNTGFVILDDNGRVLDANREYVRMTGYTSLEDISGRPVTDWTAPHDLKRNAEAVHRCLQTGSVRNLEIDYINPNKHIVPIEIHASVMSGLKPVQIITVCRDITERRHAAEEKERLSAQLIQAQKMESVGRLAGGVAHDFNNMLGVILGWADSSRMTLPQESPYREAFDNIIDAAKRSADLTQQLLAFARKQHAMPKYIDLNETVESMLKMLRRIIGEDIQLLWKGSPSLQPVFMDPAQVDQILANLCVNARDAIGNKNGIVNIETDMVSLDSEFCSLHTGIVPGRYAMLAVHDNGCGMTDDIIAKIFDPFYTTKNVGKGTGLGLATVYGIVDQNHGAIDVTSNPGKGSTFRIYLPSHMRQPDRSNRVHKTEPSRGVETILLVEDEEAVLDATTLMLKTLGYKVITSSRPAIALQLAREHAGTLSLLITDVVMPEQNGRDLAHAIRSLLPDLKCLYISGYATELIAKNGLLEEGIGFLQKPFTLDYLAAKVREILQ